MTSQYGRGTVLHLVLDSPSYRCDSSAVRVFVLKAVAVFREEASEIALFLLNRELEASIDFHLELTGFILEGIVEALEIHSDNPTTVNTENVENVLPHRLIDVMITGGNLRTRLKPRSWNLIRVAVV